jgi:homocysteine S-methyltransferase
MTEKGDGRNAILRGIHVIDGGLATELEYTGARIDGPLWSADVLEDEPGKMLAVHRAYIEAGVQCIATCSYQVSRMGYVEVGLTAERADAALLKAVELARSAAAEFPARRVVVAASLGPYGAALHNGAEYTGAYDCSFAELVTFHRERIGVLAGAQGAQAPDVLAFETLPSLEEARAIGEALRGWPDVAAWFSFSCRDEKHVSHGEGVAECAEMAASFPQTVAVGVNCVPPSWIPSLTEELCAASDKPVIVYPNSGEAWDAANRRWTGVSDPEDFGPEAAEWFKAGAQMVGGCCRTRPAHIQAVAKAVGGAVVG